MLTTQAIETIEAALKGVRGSAMSTIMDHGVAATRTRDRIDAALAELKIAKAVMQYTDYPLDEETALRTERQGQRYSYRNGETEPPTEEGWYWYDEEVLMGSGGHDARHELYYCGPHHTDIGGWRARHWGIDGMTDYRPRVRSLKGRWWGPVELPWDTPAPPANPVGTQWTPLPDGTYIHDSIIDGRIAMRLSDNGKQIDIWGPEDMYESLSLSPFKVRLCRLTQQEGNSNE